MSDAKFADPLPGQAAAQPRREHPARVAFSFVGGAHQFWHAIPVAAALSHMANVVITCCEGAREWGGREFVDFGWPGPPTLVQAVRLTGELFVPLVAPLAVAIPADALQ